MDKDYNSILISWRNEKRPQHFSKMFELLISAFDGPINDNDFPTLIILMHEIIINLDHVNEFVEDEGFDLIIDNENLSNQEEPELIIEEKIADLLLNKLILPNNAHTIEKWINQLIETIKLIYDEGFFEEMDDIAVVFEKIGNYLVLQKRDEESVILLKAMKEMDYFDNDAYWNSKETFDGLLYLALEKENDTLGCLVTEAFENLCAMYEKGWEQFIPFMLQMHGDTIDKYDFDPEEFDLAFLNAIRNTKYEKIVLGKSLDTHENRQSLSITKEKLSSIDCKNLESKKSESEKERAPEKVGKSSLKPKAPSSSKKYRPRGIKRYFYGIYKVTHGKKISK